MVQSMSYHVRPILVQLHTSVCLIDSSIIRKLCMAVWCLMVVVVGVKTSGSRVGGPDLCILG